MKQYIGQLILGSSIVIGATIIYFATPRYEMVIDEHSETFILNKRNGKLMWVEKYGEAYRVYDLKNRVYEEGTLSNLND